MGRKKKPVRSKSETARRLQRAIKNINYNEIGKTVGVDGNTIKRWCAGDGSPSPSQLLIISEVTGRSLYWLAGAATPEHATNEKGIENHTAFSIVGETGKITEDGYLSWTVAVQDNRGLVYITGDDMRPLIDAGRKAIIDKTQEIKTGDIVVCKTADAVTLRLVTATEDDGITLFATHTGIGERVRRSEVELYKVVGVMF